MDETFAKLSALLRAHADGLAVVKDDATEFRLDVPGDKPVMFAALQMKKSYVALHLFPLYGRPEMVAALPDALKARMQGKTCFNFKRAQQVDEGAVEAMLLAALAIAR